MLPQFLKTFDADDITQLNAIKGLFEIIIKAPEAYRIIREVYIDYKRKLVSVDTNQTLDIDKIIVPTESDVTSDIDATTIIETEDALFLS